ncbi:MAG: hypothetical protein JWN04_3757 [Myxococcaceae bacterium]|nr:hypothetical protein [Myxococcaceae bacterium]
MLVESTGGSSGFLSLLQPDGRPTLAAALRDEVPSSAVQDWLCAHTMSALEDEHTQMLAEGCEDDEQSEGVLESEDRYYRVLDLLAANAPCNGVAGFAIIGSAEGPPSHCAVEVIAAIGHHLQRAVARSQAK